MARDIGEPRVDPTVYHFVSDNVDALPHGRTATPTANNGLTGYHY